MANNRVVRTLLAGLVLCVVVVASASAGKGLSGCRWRVSVDAAGPQLTGVAALGDGSVWAVGDDGVRATFLQGRGGRWRWVASRVFALDVDGVSPADVWAVGASGPGPDAVALAERWNGRRWQALAMGGRPGEYLRAVAAVSASDVWAVGADAQGGPLLEHWGGSSWRRLSGRPVHGLLHAIEARSTQAVWAVGTQGMQTPGRQSERPLAESWTGDRWRTLATPGLDWVNVNLFAVAPVSPRDAFAVGTVDLNGGLPLVLRWNGRAWSQLSTAGLPTTDVSLTAIAAFSPSNLWLAGSHGLAPAQRPLLAHWNGRRWNQSQSPQARGTLADLAALSPTNIWAAGGSLQANGGTRSLLEHYSCPK